MCGVFYFLSYASAAHRDLPSFPTRRSSDLSAFVSVAHGFVNNGLIDLTSINGGGSDARMDVSGTLTNVAGAVIRSSVDRKSTRLNSSHQINSYAVFCLKTHTISAGTAQHTR